MVNLLPRKDEHGSIYVFFGSNAWRSKMTSCPQCILNLLILFKLQSKHQKIFKGCIFPAVHITKEVYCNLWIMFVPLVLSFLLVSGVHSAAGWWDRATTCLTDTGTGWGFRCTAWWRSMSMLRCGGKSTRVFFEIISFTVQVSLCAQRCCVSNKHWSVVHWLRV